MCASACPSASRTMNSSGLDRQTRAAGSASARWSLASVSNGCAVSGVGMRLSETVPATGSKRKSRDYPQSRSGRIPQPSGIGSSSTRLRGWLSLSTRVHHHKLGWTRFRTTLPPQEQQYQLSVLSGFSPRRSLLGCVCAL
jgi:hypothetical protein